MVWLTIGGVAYVILSLTGILWPQYEQGVYLLSARFCRALDDKPKHERQLSVAG
jgi:hypothetical protein